MNAQTTPKMIMTSKLGTYKGAERARVWIEGPRLDAAGFHAKQTHYVKQFLHTATANARPYIKLTICSHDAAKACRVSGKDSHPIIDITGKRVQEHFQGYANVRVRFFDHGVITIAGYDKV